MWILVKFVVEEKTPLGSCVSFGARFSSNEVRLDFMLFIHPNSIL